MTKGTESEIIYHFQTELSRMGISYSVFMYEPSCSNVSIMYKYYSYTLKFWAVSILKAL
jgi:hypothetical protein